MASSGVPQITPSRVGPRGPDPARHVYWKLGLFSAAIFAAPLSAYYLSVDRLFKGNANYAGGLAALVVNMVLLAYVVAAFLEDTGGDESGSGARTSRIGATEQDSSKEKKTK